MPSDLRPLARFAVWLAASYLFFAGPVAAQDGRSGEPPPVVAVRVVAESGAVLQQNPPQLSVQPGQPFSIEAEGAGLRELFRTGQYADLRAELADVPGGVRLDYVIRPNFYINRVQIEGVREPPGEALALSSLRLNVGETFRASDMKDALDRLRQTLEDDGQYETKLDYVATPHPDTLQMDIVVRVTAGPRARLGAVTIQNQTQFRNDELRGRLKLKEGKPLTADLLNRAADRERKWLAGKDYLGARVTVHRGAYDANSNRVPVEFTLYAGLEVRLAVEGAKLPERMLRRMVPIFQEGAVDEDLLQEGRRALREYFERDGYFDAQVSYTTTESPAEESGSGLHPPARTVTYHVERGDHHRLVGVEFTGNQYFSSGTLTGRLKIQPAAYASPGRYSSELLLDDVASIRTLYDSNGFEQIQVQSQLLDDYQGHRGDLFVRFEVKEGRQTRVADLSIDGNTALSQDELMSVVGSTKGQPYSDFNVSSDRDNILALYYDQGFSEATFAATVDREPSAESAAAPRVQLTYHITEGRQVRVARVLLSGYEHTRPGVISREVGIRAGEPLSEGAVVETQRKLYNLGIFSRVSIAPQNALGDTSGKTIIVMVDEAKRYTIAYGGGFEAQRLGSEGSSVAGSFSVAPRGILEITKANLTGRADSLSFKVRASTIQGRASLTYTAPNYFASPNFTLQLTAFFDKTRDVQTFDSERSEGSILLTERLNSASKLIYRVAYRHVIATNLNIQITPEEIPLYSQNTEVSEIGSSWLRDHRNSISDPSSGDFENVDIDLAMKAIGSSTNFLRVYLQNSTYHPLGRRLVFARSTRFGIQTPYGSTISGDIPLPERFFAGGGTSLRGFGLNQAGPRDPATGFPIGGQAELIFNQDLRFPMHLPWIGDRLGGAVFYDAGNVFPSIREISLRTAPPAPTFNANNICLSNCTNELSYFSHTAGFEFRYGTPIGPVALDLGYQLNAARFVVQLDGTCVSTPAAPCASTLSKLPGFQFFINLGTSF